MSKKNIILEKLNYYRKSDNFAENRKFNRYV